MERVIPKGRIRKYRVIQSVAWLTLACTLFLTVVSYVVFTRFVWDGPGYFQVCTNRGCFEFMRTNQWNKSDKDRRWSEPPRFIFYRIEPDQQAWWIHYSEGTLRPGRVLFLPSYIVLLLTLAAAIGTHLWAGSRIYRLKWPRHCRRCKYDLLGVPFEDAELTTCPECGYKQRFDDRTS